MQRRSFLIGSGMVALSQALAACGNQEQNSLKIQLLKGSIPLQLIEEFPSWCKACGAAARAANIALEVQVVEQLQEILNNLQNNLQKTPPDKTSSLGEWRPWGQPKVMVAADLVSLGDSWLPIAIAQNLLQPLPVKDIPAWQNLPPLWQSLVRRDTLGNPQKDGQVWGAPYRWGTTMIAYRKDKFQELGWTPQDWGDLWRQELRGKISLLNQPREIIGLTLKKLGYSYNDRNPAKIPTLRSELQALNHQTMFYSSDRYLQPLMLEDTWAAVGWSADILPLMKRNPQIAAIIPPSGTALWADMWVQPQGRELSAGAKSWIGFCWEAASANKISLLSNATSPMVLGIKPEALLPDLRSNSLLLPAPATIDRSEFIEPLPPSVMAQYLALWQEIRQKV